MNEANISDRLFIDVREPNEYQSDHVQGAINLPPAELMAGAKVLEHTPRATELVLYCRTGSRSNVAMQILRQLGFTNLVNGINADQVRHKYSVN